MPDITIDKSSLVYDDNEFEYKTRVPGTFGEDIRYLWIKKDDVDEINEGKTILTSLDDESKYMLYDKDDNLAETVRGSELYINHYDPVKEKENTESKNFDTINEKKSKSVGVKEENYLKNAEMSVEDDYDSIDGIINNGNKQQEYDKLKESESEKKSERRTAPLSRNQIKQNANTIAHNEQQTKDKNKTQGQEL